VQDSPDGFLLQGDCSNLATCQVIVFVAELGPDGCLNGSSAAAAGFSVDSNLFTRAAEAALRTGGPAECGAAQVVIEPTPRPTPWRGVARAERRVRFRTRSVPPRPRLSRPRLPLPR
jgi:hypothetical protein